MGNNNSGSQLHLERSESINDPLITKIDGVAFGEYTKIDKLLLHWVDQGWVNPQFLMGKLIKETQ